jgi:hypothetical protein
MQSRIHGQRREHGHVDDPLEGVEAPTSDQHVTDHLPVDDRHKVKTIASARVGTKCVNEIDDEWAFVQEGSHHDPADRFIVRRHPTPDLDSDRHDASSSNRRWYSIWW